MTRLAIANCLLLGMLGAVTAVHAGLPPRLSPDIGSPLASDGQWLYGVTGSGTTLIVRPLARDSQWRLLVAPTFGRVTGLAAATNALFVADGAIRGIARLTPGSSALTRIPVPDVDVIEIAYAGALFAVDGRTGHVLRVAEDGKTLPAALPGLPDSGRAFLAADGSGLIVSYPDTGAIYYVSNPARAQPVATVVYRTASAGKVVKSRDVLQEFPYPTIHRPARVSLHRGIVYVIDEADGALYAMSRHYPPRPVRCALQLSAKPITPAPLANVIAHADALTAILRDGRNEDWPRLVPVELIMRATDQTGAVIAVYDYLFRAGILPTRTVPMQGDIVTTLRANGGFAGPDTATSARLLCFLNRGACVAGQVKAARGAAVVIPDVRFERFIRLVDSPNTTLDGAVTAASQSVRTDELKVWTGVDVIRAQNPARDEQPQSAGPTLIPVEFVRYVVPMDRDDVPTVAVPKEDADDTLRRLAATRVIEFVTLEETPASPSANGNGVALSPPWNTLQKAFDKVAETISYEEIPPQQITPGVGVAEEYIHPSHPDFCPGQTCFGFAPLAAEEPSVPPPSSSNAEPALKEKMEDSDHGTMVASAIAARRTRYGRRGFAPNVILHRINSAGGQIGEGINSASLSEVRIFNLSVSYDAGVPTDLDVQMNNQQFLFVVASSKHGASQSGEMCVNPAVKPYPACDQRPNMIVVTSTTADGKHLVAGANWGKRVDVAAPGEGFYLAARPDTYAPVDGGSSFAVPLVTATAAALYAQVQISPFAIRGRIIATADPRPDWKILGGLLNVRRAVRNPDQGSLDGKLCRRPLVDPIVLKQVAGPPLTLAMNQILRLHSFGHHMRLVYVEGGQIQVESDVYFSSQADSKFTCRAQDGTTTTEHLEGAVDYVGPVIRALHP